MLLLTQLPPQAALVALTALGILSGAGLVCYALARLSAWHDRKG
jgi:hypothetical protein